MPYKREEVPVASEWFHPSNYNNFNRYLRVMISSKDEATVEVVLTDPVTPEYQIVNLTEQVVNFGQMKEVPFWQKVEDLEEMLIAGKFSHVDPLSDRPFAWENRTISKRVFGLRVGQSVREVDMEKVMKQVEI